MALSKWPWYQVLQENRKKKREVWKQILLNKVSSYACQVSKYEIPIHNGFSRQSSWKNANVLHTLLINSSLFIIPLPCGFQYKRTLGETMHVYGELIEQHHISMTYTPLSQTFWRTITVIKLWKYACPWLPRTITRDLSQSWGAQNIGHRYILYKNKN